MAITILEKAQILDFLDKDFKTTILKMFKELKEDMENVQKNHVSIEWKY